MYPHPTPPGEILRAPMHVRVRVCLQWPEWCFSSASSPPSPPAANASVSCATATSALAIGDLSNASGPGMAINDDKFALDQVVMNLPRDLDRLL